MRRKGTPSKNKALYKAKRTRRYGRDIDQIVLGDMLPEETQRLLNQPLNENLPGLGQHYDVHCARYFITKAAIDEHFKTKEHKKRFKICTTEVPYSHAEGERAVGL